MMGESRAAKPSSLTISLIVNVTGWLAVQLDADFLTATLYSLRAPDERARAAFAGGRELIRSRSAK